MFPSFIVMEKTGGIEQKDIINLGRFIVKIKDNSDQKAKQKGEFRLLGVHIPHCRRCRLRFIAFIDVKSSDGIVSRW